MDRSAHSLRLVAHSLMLVVHSLRIAPHAKRIAHSIAMCAIVGATGALLSACQHEYRTDASRLVSLTEQGDYILAADDAAEMAAKHVKDEQNGLVYELEAARTAQIAQRWPESAAFFEAAHARVRPYLDEKAESKVSEAFATTLINQTTAIYRGTPNERIMLCTFQSLDAMAQGDWAAARVCLRRAHEWQQDAAVRYKKAAEEARRATKEAEREEDIDAGAMVSGDEFSKGIAQAPGMLHDLSGYGNYANPFTAWLRGTFLCYAPGTNWQDRANGRTDLLHAASMLDGAARAMVNQQIKQINATRPTAALPPTWFIVQCAGLAPHKEEWKVTLPLPIGDTFVLMTAAYPYIAQSGAPVTAIDGSVVLADFDRIVTSEFDEIKGIIYAQETLSAALKAAASYAVQQSDQTGWAALGMIIAQLATQAADLRTWRTLPRTIHAVAVPTPKTGVISITLGTGTQIQQEVTVSPGSSGLILVTTPNDAGHAQVSTIPFETTSTASTPPAAPKKALSPTDT